MGFLSDLVGSIGGSLVSGIFNRSSAQDQMAFQQQMSNTSYQRAVEDMKLAGINPMLAAKVGGASTPGGAGWSMPDMGGAVSSAVQAQRTRAETSNIKKQGDVLDKQVQDAEILEEIYKDFPWLRVAKDLSTTSPAAILAAKGLDYFKGINAEETNSAKGAKTYPAKPYPKFNSSNPIRTKRQKQLQAIKKQVLADFPKGTHPKTIMREYELRARKAGLWNYK
jgi:hypothetical protein